MRFKARTIIVFLLFISFGAKTSLAQKISLTYKYRIDEMAIFHNDSQVCPYVFTELCEFSDGLSWAAKGELYGYVDSFGNEVIPFIYHDVRSFKNGVAFVSPDSGYHFQLINKNGEVLSENVFKECLDFEQNLAPVAGESKWGLINIDGQLVLDTIYDHPPVYLNSNFVVASQNGLFGVVNSNGRTLHPFTYGFINPNGEAWIEGRKKWLNLR